MNRLKTIMEEKEVTADMLALSCDISVPSVYKLSHQGNRGPALRTAYMISTVLECTVYDIWPNTASVEKVPTTVDKVVFADVDDEGVPE